ncbi:MAG TPA: DUF1835 domain-containing protein, partial [Paraburkholderia sp.]|nr:DUF1835 domain-containing protein [Paraburkholderia sp.]
MSTIHLTNGDVAAESLRTALQQAGRDERVQALRDDLAVGPLRGVDDAPDVRADFWAQASADTKRDFLKEFREQAALLDTIAHGEANLVVWHAQSAADQLTLRRICYYLRNSPQRLNEVRLSVRDLTDPGAWAHSRKDQATSVGMFAPDVLQARLPQAAPISVLRISRLALEWQEVKHANGETRRWRDNTFTSGTFAELDSLIVDLADAACDDVWLSPDQVGAALPRKGAGFTVREPVVLWRLRELAANGALRMRDDLHVARAPGDPSTRA